ncbi:CBO0543 family protein [Neobacillus thermocopriae]|uniref:CBO0543 family protein n=1 Tax=Neobacillus thermocopriae TaxID=1215031 RepID=UPI0030845237
MSIVRPLNDSKSLLLQKRRLTFLNKNYVICAVFASLIGTYLDLYFIGKGVYWFPIRPWSNIFSVNLWFTLVILPVFVIVFLHYVTQIHPRGKAGMILFISLLMPIMERLSEMFGWFAHSEKWEHIYSFFGYMLFLSFIYGFYLWLEKEKEGQKQ